MLVYDYDFMMNHEEDYQVSCGECFLTSDTNKLKVVVIPSLTFYPRNSI